MRAPLIAYNVNLATTDLKIAERVAKSIRFRDGGFRFVKALGFEVKEKGCVQVSINMTDYTKTPLYRVFETVKREAARWGVNVIESEIVGLVPQGALNASARYFLQLNNFKKEQVLENRLVPAKGLPDFLTRLSERNKSAALWWIPSSSKILIRLLSSEVALIAVPKHSPQSRPAIGST